MNINLKKTVQQAIEECGFHHLTAVQNLVIPSFLEGKNLLVQAKTGAGKTAAYLIPLIQKIEALDPYTRAIVITPTRELAQQVSRSANRLSVYAKVKTVTLIGDTAIQNQRNALKHNPNIVVATPGRFLDLYRQGEINLNFLQTIVLDEADQLFSNGQESEAMEIISLLPRRQTCLFSATLDDRMNQFFQNEFETIQTDDPNQLNEKITTFHIETEQKEETMLNLLKQEEIKQAIIFMNFIQDTLKYETILQKNHILAAAFSSYYNQRKRNRILEDFRQGKIRVLVASDAAARGLDLPDISHIIHYDLPVNFETYLHRCGRSAHRGENGISILLLNRKEKSEALAQRLIESSAPYQLRLSEKHNLDQFALVKQEKKPDTQTLLIRAGKKDKIRVKDIVGAFCALYSFEEIGTIEIQDEFSTVVLLNRLPVPNKIIIKKKARIVEQKVKGN